MNDSAAVRVRDCIARCDHTAHEPAERQRQSITRRHCLGSVPPLDCSPERFTFNQAHRVVWSPIRMAPEAVNRHDPRMFELACYLGLEQEPSLRTWVMRKMGL
jgi:hypothetical protein